MPGLDTTGGALAERRRFASVLHAVHRPWFAIRVPRGVGILTTIGRKSGSPRVTYIKAVRDGDRAYLVAITGQHTLWVKNIQANPAVRLRLTDGTYIGEARQIAPADPVYEAARERFCGVVHPFDYAENLFHRKGLPSRRKIIELHRAWFEGGTSLVVELNSRV
ncbi:nitroreductase family deazaflavin-dependent oxidoreductase [Mycobacteroides sp. LB1]|nr:nitroreductase family deazaflavin-dependent oxidoreductase [Mycobacteroides sp. LB1]